MQINTNWEDALGESYDGVGWYRRTFFLPLKPDQDATDIVFDGVDGDSVAKA